MATRNIIFGEGEYYHIYNRGVDKRKIFYDKQDYDYFQRAVLLALSENRRRNALEKNKDFGDIVVDYHIVSVGAYVLMPNHFHILIKAKKPEHVGIFMNKLQTAYAMYFNSKNNRSGRLFQGTFKAQHVNKDSYLKYLFAYIHLNPVKNKNKDWKTKLSKKECKQYLSKYAYSSYLDYLNVGRDESCILTKKEFPKYFATSNKFEEFVNFWIKYKDANMQG